MCKTHYAQWLKKGTLKPIREYGRKAGSEDRAECEVSDCGRPAYARRMCQTHYRQVRTFGKVDPIRAYRERRPGTVKFSGLRLTLSCADAVSEYAQERKLSEGAALAEILESWLVRGAPEPAATAGVES
jgi:hypothetical protein